MPVMTRLHACAAGDNETGGFASGMRVFGIPCACTGIALPRRASGMPCCASGRGIGSPLSRPACRSRAVFRGIEAEDTVRRVG